MSVCGPNSPVTMSSRLSVPSVCPQTLASVAVEGRGQVHQRGRAGGRLGVRAGERVHALRVGPARRHDARRCPGRRGRRADVVAGTRSCRRGTGCWRSPARPRSAGCRARAARSGSARPACTARPPRLTATSWPPGAGPAACTARRPAYVGLTRSFGVTAWADRVARPWRRAGRGRVRPYWQLPAGASRQDHGCRDSGRGHDGTVRRSRPNGLFLGAGRGSSTQGSSSPPGYTEIG